MGCINKQRLSTGCTNETCIFNSQPLGPNTTTDSALRTYHLCLFRLLQKKENVTSIIFCFLTVDTFFLVDLYPQKVLELVTMTHHQVKCFVHLITESLHSWSCRLVSYSHKAVIYKCCALQWRQ